MTSRTHGLTALAVALFATSALSQTSFPEVEPNSQKTEATAVTGIVAGDTITGTSTGTGTVLGDTAVTTVDVYRVKTGLLTPGIYKHTLTITSDVAGHTGSIRGLLQNAGGVITTTDTELQASSAAGVPARANHWFGFGLQEEVYYRVVGTAATTAAYGAVLSTATITPTIVPGTFSSGNITFTAVGQTTTDTEIYIYDSSLNPIPGYHNDDTPGSGLQSTLTRFIPGGTYYVAVSDFNTANNLSDANADENFTTGAVLDFPNALCSGDRETGAISYNISITGGGPAVPVALSGNGEYDIAWAQITVANTPPPNDACASATPITNTATGYLPNATNDGTASCDPGGAASRDVWYSFNAGAYGGTISPNTCGATETVLTVYNGCGGAELGCNDDCGGSPCGGPSSCLSGLVLAANQVVILRVSDKGVAGGLFTLAMNFAANTPLNDDCAAALPLAGPGVYPFDTTVATTGQSTTGTCGGPPVKNLWYVYTATTNGTLTLSTCGQTGGTSPDTEIWIYQGAGCPTAAAIACNDDFCGLETTVSTAVTCGTVYMLEVGNYTFQTTANIFGTFTVTETGTACSTPSTSLCLGDGTGPACPCANNSTTPGSGCATTGSPGGATLSATGIASDETAGTDTLVLTGTGLTGPGLFFQADAAPGVFSFGDGHLCASQNIQRMGVVFPISGVAIYPGGLTPFEIHTFGNDAGETKFYQCWYRSSPALCNPGVQNYSLTQAITLQWVP